MEPVASRARIEPRSARLSATEGTEMTRSQCRAFGISRYHQWSCRWLPGAAVALVLACALPLAVVHAQPSVIGAVDVYGARTVSPDDVRRVLGVAAGDPAPADGRDLVARVRSLRGVTTAEVSVVCCVAGRSVVYVGVQESRDSPLRLRAEPQGIVRLPEGIVQTEEEFTAALREAVAQGQADEDHSAGHALMKFPRARAAQERFIDLAVAHEDQLRDVLRESRFPLQRALAAQVLGYLPDKRNAAAILASGLDDPSAAVRNDAARALWVIAGFARDSAEILARIPRDPLLRMLASVVWTDRNKASLVLMALTAARDTSLLDALKSRAMPELVEMAGWHSPDHALAPLVILGRIAGMPDDAIFAAWSEGDRQRVIRAATGTPEPPSR